MDGSDDSSGEPSNHNGWGLHGTNDDDSLDENDVIYFDDDDDDDDNNNDDDAAADGNGSDHDYDGAPSNWASELSSAGPISDMDEGESESGTVTLQLREILFYDDRVSVFKARHAAL